VGNCLVFFSLSLSHLTCLSMAHAFYDTSICCSGCAKETTWVRIAQPESVEEYPSSMPRMQVLHAVPFDLDSASTLSAQCSTAPWQLMLVHISHHGPPVSMIEQPGAPKEPTPSATLIARCLPAGFEGRTRTVFISSARVDPRFAVPGHLLTALTPKACMGI
jgi:hypothetical protein